MTAEQLEHKKQVRRAWTNVNAEKIRSQNREWREKNKERTRVTNRAWWRMNKGRVRASRSQYMRLRKSRDPLFRMSTNLRIRVNKALVRGTKSGDTFKLLGCSLSELRAHLESQFRPGMMWENYGPVWHIDHRRPCASFDLMDPAQQRECFNFKNLQPLFAEENLKKGAK